jgi:hypothetical protein
MDKVPNRSDSEVIPKEDITWGAYVDFDRVVREKGPSRQCQGPFAISWRLPLQDRSLFGLALDNSYDFDTASTGIQETESLGAKAAKR